MNNGNKRQPIYRHTHLDVKQAAKLKPLFESAFGPEFQKLSGNPMREQIKNERMDFATKQFANRARVAQLSGVNPLNEDSQIFGSIGGNIKQLFESVSMPGNIIGMGDVVNPEASSTLPGNIWNPAYKAGSGDIPSYVFGLQSHVALHCNAFDMIPLIAVDTPKVTTNYIDEVYGGGNFDSTEALPSYIKIGNPLFNMTFVETNNLKRATTKLVLASGATGEAMEVLFMVRSAEDTSLIVEVLSVGATVTGTYTAAQNKDVASVITAINAGATPIVYIVGGGNENLIVGKTTIGYASATRTNLIEATTNNNGRKGMTRAQHLKGPKHKINIISIDKSYEMVGLEIEADTDNLQIKDLAAAGVNVISRLYNSVHNLVLQNLDEIILNHLYSMGVTHAVNAYQAQGINHSLYIAAPNKPSMTFSDVKVDFVDVMGDDRKTDMGVIVNSIQSSAYENQTTHADRLFARILLTAEFIGQQNRIAPPDFIVFGGGLAAAAKKHSSYIVSPTANTLSDSPEIIYSGTLFQSLNVYKNSRIPFNDPRILIGRRGDDTDPGAKFLAYDLASSAQTTAEQTMSAKIRIWSRFQIADVGFYPELNYYTLVAINEYNWA